MPQHNPEWRRNKAFGSHLVVPLNAVHLSKAQKAPNVPHVPPIPCHIVWHHTAKSAPHVLVRYNYCKCIKCKKHVNPHSQITPLAMRTHVALNGRSSMGCTHRYVRLRVERAVSARHVPTHVPSVPQCSEQQAQFPNLARIVQFMARISCYMPYHQPSQSPSRALRPQVPLHLEHLVKCPLHIAGRAQSIQDVCRVGSCTANASYQLLQSTRMYCVLQPQFRDKGND
jgi:hypothetical protein